MEMAGEQLIQQPQRRVWDAICDPAVLKICIPGCDSMERVSDTEFNLTMATKVGPVSAKFRAKITLVDVSAPDIYTLVFEGQGGVAGFATGRANVKLAPIDQGTRLSYTANAMVGGKIAQVGSRLIDGVAKKLADRFFANFNEHISPVER